MHFMLDRQAHILPGTDIQTCEGRQRPGTMTLNSATII